MSEGSNVANMSLAPGVIDTIIGLAATEAKGVAAVEVPAPSGIRGLFAPKASAPAISVEMTEAGKAQVELHIRALYGYSLLEVAAEVRAAVADALLVQAGVETDRVDIFIDSIAFAA